MHFFNPVPLMKLVEVVSGLRTDDAVAAAIVDLSARWGKVPVHARSTPGFIVNRIARPYYAEALTLLNEQAATPAQLDACLRAAGFRMGPCELMDLIGHDTNFAVTQSVFDANFGDKRYAPSIVQRELVDGGLLGRKSGRGFFDPAESAAGRSGGADAAAPEAAFAIDAPSFAGHVVLHGTGPLVERWRDALVARGVVFEVDARSGWQGLAVDDAQLRLTDGRPATGVAADEGRHDIALFDALPVTAAEPGAVLAWTAARCASGDWQVQAARWLALAGMAPVRVGDAAGLVVARTIAMLVNEACDAVQQGVCTPDAADAAMKLGVNWPRGPFEWLAAWDAREVVALLDHLDAHYRGERYRASPELRQRAWTLQLHASLET
jgi:3-hydroxybutyryl-CoA dehydrogenase